MGDSDGDGLGDGLEVLVGSSPFIPDTDGDCLTDYDEYWFWWPDDLLVPNLDENGESLCSD